MRFIGGSFMVALSGLCVSVAEEEVMLKTENAVVITFPSQSERSYKLLGASSAAGTWKTLQDGIVGTGGEVTIFYKSQSDQKVFFKVETSDGPPGQRSLLSLARLDLSNQDLSGYNLEGTDLRNFKLRGAKFDNANLVAANLSEANLENASLQGADLSHAIVQGMAAYNANFSGANLEGVTFEGSSLVLADLRNARIMGTRFLNTSLGQANLAGQNLSGVVCRGSFLDGANLSGVNLRGTDLSRGSIAGANIVGADFTGANFEGSSIAGVDFAGRDLRGMNLRGVAMSGNWTGVNAAGVDMSLSVVGAGSRLARANFQGANLEALSRGWSLPGVNLLILTNANLRNANLQGADLSDADLRNADLTGANLSFANLTGANLTGAVGFDAEQPGIMYGPGPGYVPGPGPYPGEPYPEPTGTVMPDGTSRIGTNPGTPLVPALPARVLLTIGDGGSTNTIDLAFRGGKFSHGAGGAVQGSVFYHGTGRVARLKLQYDCCPMQGYTLLFETPVSGQLFKGIHMEVSDGRGVFPVGTFTIPE